MNQKKIFVDSIVNSGSYSEEKISYLYHKQAKVLKKNKELNQSIVIISKAIELRKKNKHNNLKALKGSLFNKGLYLIINEDNYRAIKIFEELSKLPNEDRLCMKAYSELIFLYGEAGDFERSISCFKKCETYFLKSNNYKELYKSYLRISRIYSSMGINKNFKKVIKYLENTEDLSEFVPISIKDYSIINKRYGNAYEEINEVNKALHYYYKSLGYSEEIKDSSAIASVYNNIGYLYIHDSSYDKAHIALNKGLGFVKNDIKKEAILHNTFATYYEKTGNIESSKDCFQKAIDLIVYGKSQDKYSNPTIKELSSSQHKLKLFEFIVQKANYWKNRYELEKDNKYLQYALSDFQLSDQLIDVLLFDSTETVSKMYWREKGSNLYINAIEVSLLLNDIESAYVFMEKNKALLLLEELHNQEAKTMSQLPWELVKRDDLLKNNILKAEEELTGSTIKDNEIFKLKQEYVEFQEKLAADFPEYSKLSKKLPVLNYEEHKKHFINQSSTTIQFIINDEVGYGLAISEGATMLYPINDVVNLQKEIKKLTSQLQQPFAVQKDIDAYAKNATTIFKRLIPKNVYHKLKGKKITVAADGSLQNIPFEALLTEEVTKDNILPYFIKTNEVNYVYSFSYLLTNSKKDRNPKHTFVGFAPESFKDDSLAKLSNSVNEINRVDSIFSGTTFSKGKASKSNFNKYFDKYQIIHLATHSGSSETDKPWLAFNDSTINLNEIYAAQNQAELVVLSACSTARGQMKSGEGVMSLARGFLFSGTNSVVSTLWNINDKTTEEMMVDFYSNLNDNQSKSEALHNTKLTYLSTHKGTLASPFYWSSLVLIGDASEIAIKSKFNWTLLILLIVGVSLILIGMYFRNKLHS